MIAMKSMHTPRLARVALLFGILSLSSCVVDPGYYDPGPPAPYYGGAYYGYGAAYPWNSGVDIDIAGGYGHGGGYRGGYRGGGRGGFSRGGGRGFRH